MARFTSRRIDSSLLNVAQTTPLNARTQDRSRVSDESEIAQYARCKTIAERRQRMRNSVSSCLCVRHSTGDAPVPSKKSEARLVIDW